MERSDIVNYFLEHHSLEGAPGVDKLEFLDDIQEGSTIYRTRFSNLSTIRIQELQRNPTDIELTRGKYFADNRDSQFFSTFPRDPLSIPKHDLLITLEDIAKGKIYHTKPF